MSLSLPKFYLYLYNTGNLIPPPHPLLPVFVRAFFFPLLSPPPTPYIPLNPNNAKILFNNAVLFGCSCFPCILYIATHPTQSHIRSHVPTSMYPSLFEFHSLSDIYPVFHVVYYHHSLNFYQRCSRHCQFTFLPSNRILSSIARLHRHGRRADRFRNSLSFLRL